MGPLGPECSIRGGTCAGTGTNAVTGPAPRQCQCGSVPGRPTWGHPPAAAASYIPRRLKASCMIMIGNSLQLANLTFVMLAPKSTARFTPCPFFCRGVTHGAKFHAYISCIFLQNRSMFLDTNAKEAYFCKVTAFTFGSLNLDIFAY